MLFRVLHWIHCHELLIVTEQMLRRNILWRTWLYLFLGLLLDGLDEELVDE